MKNIIITSILLLLLHFLAIAYEKDPNLKNKTKEWLNATSEKGFLENRGQMMDMNGKPVPQVLFKTEAPNLNIWITEEGLVLQTLKRKEEKMSIYEQHSYNHKKEEQDEVKMYWERIDVILKNASIKKQNILKEKAIQGDFNYFYPHCPDGIYEVQEYEKITIKEVYAGIDWVLYRDKKKGFKYDFLVHPNADYRQIELLYRSKSSIKINVLGEIEMHTEYGNIKENKPVSYYENKEINTEFIQKYQKIITLHEDKGFETAIGFKLPLNLSNTSLLVIDPQLWWATFYGSNRAEGPMSTTTDENNNVFVTGYTRSPNFPVQDAGTYFQGNRPGGIDAFILKFSSNGILVWATYYGGFGADTGGSITCDGIGNVFVTGYTSSTDFPVQDAGTYFQSTFEGIVDVFVIKFNNSGTRLWATYYGGNAEDRGYSITCDGANNVFITGYTNSTNFAVQDAGTYFQGTLTGGTDAFILKFNNNGTLLWATCYGGNADDKGNSITCDGSGNVFITGESLSSNFPVQDAGTYFQGTYSGGTDAFILKFANNGTQLWATYYGGNSEEEGGSIACDDTGNVFVTGYTSSNNFPVQNAGMGTYFQGTHAGGGDVFILKFTNTGIRLWATYFGGSGNDYQSTYDNLAITSCGSIYMSFYTNSNSLPLQPPCDTGGYFDDTFNGAWDIFLVLFSDMGNLAWSTYIGGDDFDFREALAVDTKNNLFMAGEWWGSLGYPTNDPSGGAYFDGTHNGSDDSFILKFLAPAVIAGGNNPVFCGENINLTASGNLCFTTYIWSGPGGFTSALQNPVIGNASPSMSGWYYVTASQGGCTPSKDSVYVNVAGLAIEPLLSSVNPLKVCTGSSVIYTIPANSYKSGWSYSLDFNGDTVPDTIFTYSSGVNSVTYTYTSAGIYTLYYTVTNDSGCTSTVSYLVTVLPALNAQIAIKDTVCEGEPLFVDNYSLNANRYEWKFMHAFSLSDALSPRSETTKTGFYVVFPASGQYLVQLTAFNELDCKDTAIKQITVFPTPKIHDITAVPDSGQAFPFQNIQFTFAHTSSVSPNTFLWTFGDNTSSVNSELASHMYTNAGLYPVQLVLTNSAGCRDTFVLQMRIIDIDSLFVPNIVTPDNDSKNDVFRIKHKNLKTYHIEIFNRWGNKVYESDNPNEVWNPINHQDGVYYYIIIAQGITGTNYNKKGNITVLR